MLLENAQQRLMSGIVNLIRRRLFYGHVVQQWRRVFVFGEGSECHTMRIERRIGEPVLALVVNVDYLDSMFGVDPGLSRDESRRARQICWAKLGGILKHEALHVCLGHLCLVFADEKRAAVACDCAVNSYIPREELPGNPVLPESFGLPVGKSAVWYYRHLPESDEYISLVGGDGLDDLVTTHKGWGSPVSDRMLWPMLKSMMRNARESCGGYGSLSDDLVVFIKSIFSPVKRTVPWDRVLSDFCAGTVDCSFQYTTSRESRRFRGVRPGIAKHEKMDIVVIVDTSMSIDDEMLGKFFSVIRYIWKGVDCNITVMECDTEVRCVYPFRGSFTGFVHGRGGTNLKLAFDEAVKMRAGGVVCLTDFQMPKFHGRYRFSTLFVLPKDIPVKQWPCRFGRVLVMPEVHEKWSRERFSSAGTV